MLTITISSFFFFNDTATTEIYTLSLHDALPICREHLVDGAPQSERVVAAEGAQRRRVIQQHPPLGVADDDRSEEHTSELQSRLHLVCRLLLEKKKTSNVMPIAERCRAAQCWIGY